MQKNSFREGFLFLNSKKSGQWNKWQRKSPEVEDEFDNCYHLGNCWVCTSAKYEKKCTFVMFQSMLPGGKKLPTKLPVTSILDVKHLSVDSYRFFLIFKKTHHIVSKVVYFLLVYYAQKKTPSSNGFGCWKWPKYHPLHLVTTSGVASCGNYSFLKSYVNPAGDKHWKLAPTTTAKHQHMLT